MEFTIGVKAIGFFGGAVESGLGVGLGIDLGVGESLPDNSPPAPSLAAPWSLLGLGGGSGGRGDCGSQCGHWGAPYTRPPADGRQRKGVQVEIDQKVRDD